MDSPNLNNIKKTDYDQYKFSKTKSTYSYFIPWKRAQNDPSIVNKGTEIHINPLPYDIKYEDIYEIFKCYGEIIDIRIIPRKDKGNCFAFLRYLHKSSTDKALSEICTIEVI